MRDNGPCLTLLCHATATGGLKVNDTELSTRDAARVRGAKGETTALRIEATQPSSHFLFVEMALS
jgi:hypothetical protein